VAVAGGGMAGHLHGVEALETQRRALESVAASVHLHDSPMWIGHALAAVVTFVMLRYGERSFWVIALLAALTERSIMFWWSTEARPRPAVRTNHASSDARPLRSRILTSVVRYRGPPALVSF